MKTQPLPALALCDVMMPALDGREMCRRMQAHPVYRSIPIVLMSAVSKTPRLADCEYVALITKPFDLEDVLVTIDLLISTTPYN